MRCLARLRSETFRFIIVCCSDVSQRCLSCDSCKGPLVLLATLGGHLFAGLPASCVILLRSCPTHISRAGAEENQDHRGERSNSLSSVVIIFMWPIFSCATVCLNKRLFTNLLLRLLFQGRVKQVMWAYDLYLHIYLIMTSKRNRER